MLAAAAHSEPVSPVHVLIETATTLWMLWAIVAALGVGRLAWRLYKFWRLRRSGIDEVDQMDGATFERFLATVFRSLGYRVEHTGRRGDYGADLVIAQRGRRVVVQAKRWTKNVGVTAVQEVVAAKAMRDCTHALVVANRSFTKQARTLARANGVELWDREVLIGKLLSVR